jgi:hypothetical protein
MGIPMLQIRDSSVLMYSVPTNGQHSSLRMFRKDNLKLNRGTRYSGKLTTGAKSRLTRAITLLTQIADSKWIFNEVSNRMQFHKLSFITLTVSATQEKFSGREAYDKLLVHFLQWMRRTKNVTTYLWKLEFQANGQIHYHITTPTFIAWQAIKDKWNNLQRSTGTIDQYRANQLEWHKGGFKLRDWLVNTWSPEAQYQAYLKGMANDWQEPNSIDVHAVEKVDDMASYLCKEIAKSCQNETATTGKIWDCSKNLKATKLFSMEVTAAQDKTLEEWEASGKVDVVRGDYFNIYRCGKQKARDIMNTQQLKMFKDHLDYIKNYSEEADKPPDKCLVSLDVNIPSWIEQLKLQTAPRTGTRSKQLSMAV